MSGGQHRDDEANGLSWSSELETKGSRKRESNQPNAHLRKPTGVLRKIKKQDKTFLTEPTSLEMLATVISVSAPFGDAKRIYFRVASNA